MWPPAFWERVYEPLIRRAAGLGRLSGEPDPDGCEKAFAFCDLLVIGAGPAGLMAALTAGRAGARVILADEDFLPGGRLNAERLEVGGRPGGGLGGGGGGGARGAAERAADAADDGDRAPMTAAPTGRWSGWRSTWRGGRRARRCSASGGSRRGGRCCAPGRWSGRSPFRTTTGRG